MRRLITATLAAITLGTAAVAAPPAASAAPGPAESYLFVVDGSAIQVVPGKGDAARVVIKQPRALRFSDRPYRHVRDMSVRGMLKEFGWSPKTHKLADSTPNAGLAVAGSRTQIVDIRKAWRHGNRLVLSVRGVEGPLTKQSGRGSVFIDNVGSTPAFPQSQTTNLYTDPTFGDTFTATATLTSAVAVTVSVSMNGEQVVATTLNPLQPVNDVTATVGDGYAIPFTIEIVASASFSDVGAAVEMNGTIIGPDTTDNLLPPVPVSASWGFSFG